MDEQSLPQLFSILVKKLMPSIQQVHSTDNWLMAFEYTMECIRRVESLQLFSENETMEEIHTSYFPYLILWRYLSILMGRKVTIGTVERVHNLQEAIQYGTTFSEKCRLYSILDYQILSLKIGSNLDPTSRRQIKISRARLELEFKKASEIVHDPNATEEQTREGWISYLKLTCLQNMSDCESFKSEAEMLGQKDINKSMAPPVMSVASQGRPKLSVVNQNFVLLPSNNPLELRETERQKVFRAGHNLPTMTVDEYLRLEAQRGNIIKSSAGVEVNPESDDDEEMEKRRQKDISFDLFKDNVSFGSGNTRNIG